MESEGACCWKGRTQNIHYGVLRGERVDRVMFVGILLVFMTWGDSLHGSRAMCMHEARVERDVNDKVMTLFDVLCILVTKSARCSAKWILQRARLLTEGVAEEYIP